MQALATGSYVLVGRSLWAFILVASICIASMQGADAARGALVGRLAAEDPVGLRAVLPLRDWPYLALTASNAVMALQYFVLAFAMPLWVIGHTHAPRWLVSPMLLINTCLVAVFQVRLSRGAKTPRSGARSITRAGVVLAAAMVLYSAASGRGELAAVVILLTAVLAHSLGELLQSAGAFGISYGLASESALGEYLGTYGLSLGVCRAVAPGVLAATCLTHGYVGWVGLGAAMMGSGLVTPVLVTWAEGRTAVRLKNADASAASVVADPAALTASAELVDLGTNRPRAREE